MTLKSKLFSPLTIAGVTLKNRLVVSPMCQYTAGGGIANDWHFAHYARFALGGFGMVMIEATGVAPEGRISHGDLGLWNDAQAVPLARIAAFLRSQGAVPAIQLAHAGRKGSMQRPWQGDGPLNDTDKIERAETAWPVVAPSAIPHGEGWLRPDALDDAGLDRIEQAFASAARRAAEAGLLAAEIHCAHGYLLHEFLSPLSNKRTDAYGGAIQNRMRFPLRVIDAVRAAWPRDRALFLRISAIDGAEGGWTIEDSIVFAREAKARGVDVIDVSSGGVARTFAGPGGPLFQVPFAERIRAEAKVETMTVGLITEPAQAHAIIEEGRADLVAMGREALSNPHWPLHAEKALEGNVLDYGSWPVQSGHWLARRAATLAKLAGK